MAINKLPVKVTLAADSSIPAAVRLARVTGINGKTEAQTNLYTVPTGKRAIITKILLRMTSASNVTGVATVSAGVAAEFEDVVAETALTGFDTTNMVATLSPIALTAVSVAAAGVLKLDVDTAATTTGAEDTYTFEAHVFGFLI